MNWFVSKSPVSIRSLILWSGLLLLALILSSAGSSVRAAANPADPPFSMADRVACQTAAETIYWQHREWPAVNPTPKPALAEVMPAAAIAAKVADTARYSHALETFWHTSITGEMLQAEIDRQATHTQDPAMLQELWAALGNDPAHIAECLARPVLAKRLVQNWQAQDTRFTNTPFEAWWAGVKNDLPTTFTTPVYDYRLPAIAESPQTDDTWVDTAAIPGDGEGVSVWTGTEMIFYGRSSTQGHRYNPTTDTWEAMNTVGAPHRVYDFTAVWSGTEMITWGGCTGQHEFCTTSAGGRYNPTTDTWTPTDTATAPIGRRQHGAVWSGSEMIIWGGCHEDANGNQNCNVVLNSGGRYDPITNSWQPTSLSNAPTARNFPELVWAGDQMILWTGTATADPGRRYDPISDSWQSISTTNAPAGREAALIWTGDEMIAWGGCTGSPFCDTPQNDGGRYDPVSDSWTAVTTINAPTARWGHDTIWTGTEMIVWGGTNGTGSHLNSGGRYNPITNSWMATSTTGAPSPRSAHTLWTGSLMLVWGGVGSNNLRNGARYEPGSDSWTPISAKDPFSFRNYHSAIWTGVEMIAWGGEGDGTASTGLDTGRIYDPVTDSWSDTSVVNAPSPRDGHSAIWTGTEMIIWGGDVYSWFTQGTGGRYNPMTDSWTPTNEATAPVAKALHTAVWTGTEMIIWGGSVWDNPWDGTGARYNPAGDSWTDITNSGAPSPRYLHSSVWTGDEMLIWGGAGSTGPVGTGARYNPTTNTWAPIASTNAPAERVLHSTIWDGTTMIVWGGTADYGPWILHNDGGRYNPATDTWTDVNIGNAPAARARHTAVWTGDEMIVWSGCTNSANCLQGDAAGGRYDPQTDTWTATSTTGAPEARQWHTAVWTGDAMIVWAGLTDDNGISQTGGLYFADTSGNNAPQASNDSYSALAGETLTVAAPGVLANDNDPDGDGLMAVLLTSPVHGLLSFNLNGSFSYTPTVGFVGTDSFTYRASDGDKLSNAAVVGIAVTDENNAPTAVPDAYELNEDEPLVVPVPGILENDHDPDGDPLSAELVLAPLNGTLSLQVDGSFIYTPTAHFHGADSFTYRVSDGLVYSPETAVTLTINAVNDDPAATDDAYEMAQDTVLEVSAPGVLVNDEDVDGDGLTAVPETLPTHGDLVLQTDGSFTYTPHTGFVGNDSFTYQAEDGQGGSSLATVSITVNETAVFHIIYLPIVTSNP
ncbi:MAG: tandem-95 repeat protein [Anaerolineae bacterium]|nr:tandem-95 repeat protein [Anaerolineae bacterium]